MRVLTRNLSLLLWIFAFIAVAVARSEDGLALDLGNGVKLELAKISAGTFDMGSPPGEQGRDDDEKQHRVTITTTYYIGKYPVTVGQFREFARAENYKTDAELGTPKYENGQSGAYFRLPRRNPQESISEFNVTGNWTNPGFKQAEDEPVVCVSWNDTQKFAAWLSKRIARKVRLPTEAEWEYACRAGSSTPFSTGETIRTDQANCDGDYPYGKGVYRGKTVRDPGFKPNAFGLFDVHGNVWQWCQDLYRKDYEHLSANDPINNSNGSTRVMRGGSWYYQPGDCRSASRTHGIPQGRGNDIGFRIVVPFDDPKPAKNDEF